MPRTIGDRIKAARAAKGWTQEQLAAASGVPLDTLRKVERGANNRPRALGKIADALDVTEMQLEYDVEDSPPPPADAPLEPRVVLDDEYEALPGDLEKVWVAYSELDHAHRDRLRRQRWDGGPPALADLMTRAASLLAIQKGKAVVSKAPVLQVADDPDAPRFR